MRECVVVKENEVGRMRSGARDRQAERNNEQQHERVCVGVGGWEWVGE